MPAAGSIVKTLIRLSFEADAYRCLPSGLTATARTPSSCVAGASSQPARSTLGSASQSSFSSVPSPVRRNIVTACELDAATNTIRSLGSGDPTG